MTELSISVSGFGLTWPLWKKLVEVIEGQGFSGLYVHDHFTVPLPIYVDSMDMLVALGYLADHSRRVQFGSLVAPLSFRDPVLLARQAIALDNLSGGRMILGVGVGWQEREHEMFGYQLGDVRTRLDRFEEGLEVITLLLRSDQPVSYEGRFFRLHDALLKPRPERPGGPPILVGASGPKRALPLVARYADIWSGENMSPQLYHERSSQLGELLLAAGRPPGDIKKTFNTLIFCGRNAAELERRVYIYRGVPAFADMPLDTLFNVLRSTIGNMLVGSPDYIIEQIQLYSAAGAKEVTLDWSGHEDIEGLQLIAEEVLPYV